VEQFDVCIVGGGIAGASVAFHAAPHACVLVLERETQVGYHSTGRSAAVYSPQYGSLLNRRLTRVAGPFLQHPPAGFTATPLLSPRGFLTIGDDHDLDARASALADAAATGETLVSLTPAEIRARIPFLKPEAVTWGLLDTRAEDMDVEAMLQGYLRGARLHGAVIKTDVEIAEIAREGAAWRIRGIGLDVRAAVVVNAAGAWADPLGALAGARPLGVIPHRRTAFVCDVPAGTDLCRCPMTIWGHESFYFKPEAGRLLGCLAEENPTAPCDPQPEDLDVAIAVDRIERVINFEIKKLVRAWTGLRSFVADRDPISGFDPDLPGFYWHGALGGYGIQTSAALGAFAAAQILGHPLPEALQSAGILVEHLSPSRLGVRP
jgi:D-arginine dehydrogenase